MADWRNRKGRHFGGGGGPSWGGALQGGLGGFMATGSPWGAAAGAALGGSGILNQGKSPQQRRNDLLNNEFRGMSREDYMPAGVNQAMAQNNMFFDQFNQSPEAQMQRDLLQMQMANARGQGVAQENIDRRLGGQVAAAGQEQRGLRAASGRNAAGLANRTLAGSLANISGQAGITGTQADLQAQLAGTSAAAGLAGGLQDQSLRAQMGRLRGNEGLFRLNQTGQLAYTGDRTGRFGVLASPGQRVNDLTHQDMLNAQLVGWGEVLARRPRDQRTWQQKAQEEMDGARTVGPGRPTQQYPNEILGGGRGLG